MGPAYSLNNETDIMWEIFHYGPVQGKCIRIVQCVLEVLIGHTSCLQPPCGFIQTSSPIELEYTADQHMELQLKVSIQFDWSDGEKNVSIINRPSIGWVKLLG